MKQAGSVMNDMNTKTKLAQDITVGDKFREYRGDHHPIYEVKRVLSPSCTGSWQECRGTGFPRLETTDGRVVMLVYGSRYEVL